MCRWSASSAEHAVESRSEARPNQNHFCVFSWELPATNQLPLGLQLPGAYMYHMAMALQAIKEENASGYHLEHHWLASAGSQISFGRSEYVQ